jgi:hypothetical protein
MRSTFSYVVATVLLLHLSTAFGHRVLLGGLDYYSIVGSQGKNICVSGDGLDVAIIYGDPTPDPDNYTEVKIAYSTDAGSTWVTYGPFSGELRRINPSVDGLPDFDTNPGHLWFAWQEAPSGYNVSEIKVMSLNETPYTLPNSQAIYAWYPCIAINRDNPLHLIVTAWSYLNGGNLQGYCWISEDGGYTWTDTIPMGIGGAPHTRFGEGDYIFATYYEQVDTLGSTFGLPFYVESTDGGYTWTSPEPLPVPFIDPDSSVFSLRFDCEVVCNDLLGNAPLAVHFDLGIDSMWLFWGSGNPGSRTWDVFNVKELGACSLWQNGSFYHYYPSRYPSIAQGYGGDIFGVYYKGFHMKVTSGDTIHNGAHIGGIHSYGAEWEIAPPISMPNTGEIAWDDWGVTEVAHTLASPPYE